MIYRLQKACRYCLLVPCALFVCVLNVVQTFVFGWFPDKLQTRITALYLQSGSFVHSKFLLQH